MDEKKISFIIPVNNENEYFQCITLINSLIVPNDFKIEIIPIRNAASMCEAYNQGLLLSNAKYKVYLHQDTYILNLEFIKNILDIFNKNKKIGLIGLCGAKNLPKNGIWWEDPNTIGKVFEKNGDFFGVLEFNEVKNDYEIVDCVDGLIIITQYDVKWREDIFDGWHFYDISQSFEFKKYGYLTAIPKQITPWCMHTRGITDMNVYEEYRQKFINSYTL